MFYLFADMGAKYVVIKLPNIMCLYVFIVCLYEYIFLFYNKLVFYGTAVEFAILELKKVHLESSCNELYCIICVLRLVYLYKKSHSRGEMSQDNFCSLPDCQMSTLICLLCQMPPERKQKRELVAIK